MRFVFRIVLWMATILTLTDTGWALPIFARRFETSCTTCHVIIPKLNAFGIAFRNNGFKIPINDARLIKTPDVALGAPAWKQLWPKAVWPGAIPGIPPIAIRVLTDVNIRPSAPVNMNFDFPNGLAAYFAGPAGDSFSFFGSVFLLGATNTLICRPGLWPIQTRTRNSRAKLVDPEDRAHRYAGGAVFKYVSEGHVSELQRQ